VALLDLVFLAIEARRYRYFDIWRTRAEIAQRERRGRTQMRTGRSV
jgi:uncharacterized membrane protein